MFFEMKKEGFGLDPFFRHCHKVLVVYIRKR